MKYSFFDILRFLIKRKWLILIIMAVFAVGGSYYVSTKQSYTAETVIQYTGNGASAGYTPNGTKIDVNEITSANIISQVISNLGLNVSTESIRGRCSIAAVIPSDVKALKEAKEKDGEEYDYFPTNYVISYTADSSKNGAYARNVLDAIISSYINFYGENHVSLYGIANQVGDIQDKSYDYIERLDIMKGSVDEHISYLSNKLTSNGAFRSSVTGYSLNDLCDKYLEIKAVKLPGLYSKVLEARATKDRAALIKRYEYKKEQALLNSNLKDGNSLNAMYLMSQFVEKNKEVPNSYSGEDGKNGSRILDDVYDNKNVPRVKNTYDKLVDDYVAQGVGAKDLLVDAAYFQTVIDQFQEPLAVDTKPVESSLNQMADELASLEEVTQKTIKEFAQSDVSNYISFVSSITMRENMSTAFYTLVALVAGALFGCVLAVFVEVMTDIDGKNRKKKRRKKA